MSKKHFIILADFIKDHNRHREPKFDWRQIDTIADFCSFMNPNFNRKRWIDYINGECGPSGGKV